MGCNYASDCFCGLPFVAFAKNGAEKRSRTVDLLITNELLYQLSYFGVPLPLLVRKWQRFSKCIFLLFSSGFELKRILAFNLPLSSSVMVDAEFNNERPLFGDHWIFGLNSL